MVRRLAAVVFTDIAGFTALAQQDEAAALSLVREQEELVLPLLDRLHGRRVKSTGDGLLLDFESAREATECAVEFQQLLHERNRRPGSRALSVRIGIHLGDVEQRGEDILGDAVNIASRIEAIAEPGGVCLSQQVFDQIRNKLPYHVERLGPRQLKGVSAPIDVYRVELPRHDAAPEARQLDSTRLAVLPFSNISPDPDDAYIADGMTEELIATMSKIRGLNVLARTSVMRFRNAERSVEEIGRELRVGSILEGSVRKAGPRIRITVQLIDALSGTHLWSESYDRSMDDLFAAQSEIAQTVAAQLRVRLVEEDRVRVRAAPTSSPEAHAWYLKGIHHSLTDYDTEAGVLNALHCFEKAIQLDPTYATAYAWLADTYVSVHALFGWSPERAFRPAEAALAKALELSPDLPEAHRSAALLRYFQHDYAAAEVEVQRANQLNPNDAYTHAYYAYTLLRLGQGPRALEEARLAVELAPLDRFANQTLCSVLVGLRRYEDGVAHVLKVSEFDPGFRFHQNSLGICYMGLGRYDEAVRVFEELAKAVPSDVYRANLGWAYGRLGRIDEARSILAQLTSPARKQPARPAAIATVLVAIGRRDDALAIFQRAHAEKDLRTLGSLRIEPEFDEVRTDPRFRALLADG